LNVYRIIKYYLFIFLVFGSFAARSQGSIDTAIPPRPNPPRLVNDIAQLMLPQQDDALEQKLDAYNDSTSTQIAVVIVPTVGDYAMVDYALAIMRKWGVGSKKNNNGVVLLIAKNDHKVFIATGYGMEGVLPDITCKQIIDNDITPNFQEGNYYAGINKAIDDMMLAAAGEYKASPQNQNSGGGNIIGIIIIIMIILFIISRINRRGGGGNTVSRGGWWIGPLIGSAFLGGWGGGGGGGFGGGGFGGGGFGGFGGGSGGGGGAGGGW
jgi:uncharacterized protein